MSRTQEGDFLVRFVEGRIGLTSVVTIVGVEIVDLIDQTGNITSIITVRREEIILNPVLTAIWFKASRTISSVVAI